MKQVPYSASTSTRHHLP